MSSAPPLFAQPSVTTCEITERNDPWSSPRAATLDDLAAAARWLRSRPDTLRSQLRSLRSHPDLLETVVRQSYWHCNGFAKIKLVVAPRFCVRLHVWPAGQGRGEAINPHGHRWEFASWVAAGQGMLERWFEETADSGDGSSAHDRYEYGPGSLRPNGGVWLREQSSRIRQPGTVYTCTGNTTHTVAPLGRELVATLVLQGPVRADSARVYVPPERSPQGSERPMLAADLHDLLIDAETAIGQSSHAEGLESPA